MRPLLFVAAAALVFAATIGAASAEEPFATPEGVSAVHFATIAGVAAEPLPPADLEAVRARQAIHVDTEAVDANGRNPVFFGVANPTAGLINVNLDGVLGPTTIDLIPPSP